MSNPTQLILNQAFCHICSECDVKPITDDGWKEGEAEQWLQDIVEGRFVLSFNLNDDGLAYPTLVA